MTVIVAVDNRDGMLFNRRRQSRDVLLRRRILDMTEGHILWANAYSAKQFGNQADRLSVDEDFLWKAEEDDFCFVENLSLLPFLEKIDRLILYRWNKDYPGDFFLDLPYGDWKLESTEEFPGRSHECITEEIYQK